MKTYRPNLSHKVNQAYDLHYYDTPSSRSTSLARPIRTESRFNLKGVAIFALVVFLTNLLTHSLFNPAMPRAELMGSVAANLTALPGTDNSSLAVPVSSHSASRRVGNSASLLLMDKASAFVHNPTAFEMKVRQVAQKLGVPPEWLMAVMYSESKFDAAVKNHKGSGATGLIQFMPITAGELGISLSQLAAMDHVKQMDYVYEYLNNVKRRYGSFDSLTDLYLAILYPRALKQDYCYTLYAKPSKSYRQNSGLDENKDGRVSVSDIDKRMQRKFPQAYMARL